MIPKITYETITEVSKKIMKLSEKSYFSKNSSFIKDEIQKLNKKQPYVMQWFSLYAQACLNKGLDEMSMATMTAAFLIIIEAFILQDEIGELEKLFGKE